MSKLLFIHHSGAVGGAGISLANNALLLSKENEVIVYAPSDPRFITDLLHQKCPDVQIIEYGRRIGAVTCYSGGDSIWSMRFLYRLLLILKQFPYWNREINKNSPDVILLNSKILCWMSLLPALRKRKSILFVRETMQGSSHRLINRIIRWLLEKFTNVVFLCDYDKNNEGLQHTHTEVLHNSINQEQLKANVSRMDALHQLSLSKDAFLALYVGGVNQMKGFDLAVQAVLQAGPQFHLIVVGNNFADAMDTSSASAKAYAEKWQNYLAQEDTHHQIHILGKQKDMSPFYAACDVLLFPMRSPHQARPVFEAGYYQKPVLITDFENIAEFVSNGKNGFAIPADSVEAIVDKLRLLFSNPEAAKAMGINNAAITAEKHDPVKNYNKLCRNIQETIQL